MGNICRKDNNPPEDTIGITEECDILKLWKFINPQRNSYKYGFLLSHGNSRWCISFDNETFTIYDKCEDVSANAHIIDANEDGFTLTATFNYVMRQSVYATPTAIKPRTLSFAFSLKDNINYNLKTYGWRTTVGVYEKGHFLEYCGLV